MVLDGLEWFDVLVAIDENFIFRSKLMAGVVYLRIIHISIIARVMAVAHLNIIAKT